MQRVLLHHLFWANRTKYLTIAVVIVAIGLARLGVWQYSRHLERAAINQQINRSLSMQPLALAELLLLPEAEREYRPIRLNGQYEQSQVLWRNRVHKGGTGYHILSVLRSADGSAVLINRGWIPYIDGVAEDWQAKYPVPNGPQRVDVIWRVDQENRSNTPETNSTKWFTIDTTAIGEALGMPLVAGFAQIQPENTDQQPDSLPYPALTSDMGMGSHLGYTVQWYAFALILLIGYSVVRIRRVRADTPKK
jgi:cytochrome oxidase assembly protein ShyY1